ncbi:MAG: hypothetical protein ACK49R_04925 [Planctomycetota bacterium]
MLRTIALLVVALLVQPLAAQQDAVNPFKIVLGNSTIAALKSNPKGLVWPFETLGPNPHDGVTVYYDPSEALVTNWKANDGTMQNLFSLDVSDDILKQIENDYGLPALISPSDRERIRGVLLRYVPPAGGALPPSPAVGPIGLGNSSSTTPPPLATGMGNSVLDGNRVTSNLNGGSQPFRPLGSSGGTGLNGIAAGSNEFYQTRPTQLQPQASDFSGMRPSFGGMSSTGSSAGNAAGQVAGVSPPPLSQPLNGQAFNNQALNNQALNNQATGDRFSSNQSLLPPPVYNPNASPAGVAQNWQAMSPQEPVIPNRRPGYTQFPQVSYNHFPDNQAAGVGGVAQSQAGGFQAPPGSGVGAGGGFAAGGPLDAGIAPATWQTERQALVTDLAESKQRSVFLLFMLFLLTGLCLYLSWLARGFYFRYAELADELRETFSATT